MTDETAMVDSDMHSRRQAIMDGDQVAWLLRMIEIRVVEDAALQLFRDGHVSGSTHTSQGQEAVAVGVAAAVRPSDAVTCTYRGHGHALALGVTPRAVLGEIAGRTIGTMGGLGGSMHLSAPEVGLLPTFAIIGSGIPVAVGAGLSAQVRGTDDVGIALFGDGSVNIGAFHEGLNLAGIWKLPCVFVIENNLYGEYSPLAWTTPIEDLADRAASYAMPGVIVDGQNVADVVEAMTQALARARAGDGPTLIEMKTYRYAGHSRSDLGLYRPDGELEQWKERDPISLLAARLIDEGQISPDLCSSAKQSLQEAVDKVIVDVLSAPLPDRAAMLKNIWS